jgi:hypothetical protein
MQRKMSTNFGGLDKAGTIPRSKALVRRIAERGEHHDCSAARAGACGSTHREIDAVDRTLVDDIDPLLDDCSGSPGVNMAGRTVEDLLSDKSITWGWLEDGFHPTAHGLYRGARRSAHGKLWSPHARLLTPRV